jgi:hypothetical protein
MEVKKYWSDVHEAFLYSTQEVLRVNRDEGDLLSAKSRQEKGYKEYKYAWTIHFPRKSWLITRYPYYNHIIAALNRGKGPLYDRYSKVYKSGINSVPAYVAYSKGVKMGNFFLRNDINDEPFLYMPKYGGMGGNSKYATIPTAIGKDGRKYFQTNVSNDYFIFDILRNKNIEHNATLWYKKRS